MKDVGLLLAELRAHGTIDSQGEFTLSLSEARRKLTQYHSSEKARYLLLLLAAGTAAGASSVTIEQDASSCRLVMPGAHIEENALLAAFGSPSRASAVAGASDLVLGLQGAFHARARHVQVKAQRPGGSFLWTLDPSSEESVIIDSGGETAIEVTIRFPQGMQDRLKGILGRLGGYAARSPEAKLLDQYCDRSLIPVTYNGERTDRPLFLPEHSVRVRVGSLGDKRLEFEPDRALHGYPWRGALALGPGAVQIVIHGVSYGQVDNLGLNGTVYHDGLERDISRENVVRDHRYETFLDDLEKARIELYNALTQRLDVLEWPRVEVLLPDLVFLFLAKKLSTESRKTLWDWMLATFIRRERLTPDFPATPAGLMRLMDDLLASLAARERVLNLLVARCGEGMRERPPGFHKQIAMTTDLYRKHYPDETLVLGYLLLGLGALHSVEGRKSDGERAWFKTLETVWSGSDGRAQELMYDHMAFAPEHILKQASAALAMHSRDVDTSLV